MKTQRAWRQVTVLALLVVLGGAVGAEEQRPEVDIVIVYDKSGSMEFDTLCYGCWEPSEEQYPNGYIYPLHWSDSTIESADHCATNNRYHERGGEYYIVIEAEEYSRLSEVLDPAGAGCRRVDRSPPHGPTMTFTRPATISTTSTSGGRGDRLVVIGTSSGGWTGPCWGKRAGSRMAPTTMGL